MSIIMFRIKQSAVARALLETERGEPREFRKLDALVNLLKELGVDKFSVSLKPCTGQPKQALAQAKK